MEARSLPVRRVAAAPPANVWSLMCVFDTLETAQVRRQLLRPSGRPLDSGAFKHSFSLAIDQNTPPTLPVTSHIATRLCLHLLCDHQSPRPTLHPPSLPSLTPFQRSSTMRLAIGAAVLLLCCGLVSAAPKLREYKDGKEASDAAKELGSMVSSPFEWSARVRTRSSHGRRHQGRPQLRTIA